MSRYENYAIKNNVFGTLSAPISSLATSIQLNDWEWARFSVNMLATLENIEDWKVKKREIIKITAISWDTLTVIRKYEACPGSDDANTQWQVSYAFSADDKISAYITKWHFDRVEDWFDNTNDEIDDILANWDDKLRTYKKTWLQIEVKPWPVLVWSAYYDFAWWTLTLTNNATNYIEINEDWNLVSNTTWRIDENTKISKVTTSWWEVTNIEDWRLWTVWGKIGWVNIHDLTEKEILDPNDELILSDSENIRQNKKVKASNVGRSLIFNWVAGEQITKWDALYYISDIQYKDISNWQAIWDSASNTKIAIRAFGNGQTGNKIKLWLQPATGSVWDLSIRLETDNNGTPSGTLISQNAYSSVNSTWRPTNVDITLTGNVIDSLGAWNYKRAIYISPNGQYLFITHSYSSTQHYVYKYTMSTPRDLTTATNTYTLDLWQGQSSLYPVGIFFSPDGTNMYVSGASYAWGNPRVQCYTLSTPRDLSTATNTYTKTGFNSWENIFFSDDGTRFYYFGSPYKQYRLSTPRDLSTATETTGGSNILQGSSNVSFYDGYTAFMTDSSGTTAQYKLSTPRDLSTAQYVGTKGLSSYFMLRFSGNYMYTFPSNTVQRYEIPKEYTKTDKEITLNWDTNYTWLIWVVLQTDISNTNYWKVWYEVLTDNERNVSTYDGSIWTKSSTNFGYIKGGIISDRILKKASASSNDTLPLVPQFAIQNCNIWDKLSYIYWGVVDITQNLELFNEYYISDTAGEINKTPGTIEYKVGFALDDNILCINP